MDNVELDFNQRPVGLFVMHGGSVEAAVSVARALHVIQPTDVLQKLEISNGMSRSRRKTLVVTAAHMESLPAFHEFLRDSSSLTHEQGFTGDALHCAGAVQVRGARRAVREAEESCTASCTATRRDVILGTSAWIPFLRNVIVGGTNGRVGADAAGES
jgi:hypothetical protein